MKAPEMQEQLKSWKQENDDIVLENEESVYLFRQLFSYYVRFPNTIKQNMR